MNRINRHGGDLPNIKHLLVGCQNLYDEEHYGEIAQPYYEALGQNVISIDITACNDSLEVDIRKPLKLGEFDFISQHGTIEHIADKFYEAHKNLHDSLKMGGVIIHENPKTGNWAGHGNFYVTKKFYEGFDKCYDILELTEEVAMGNYVDGWNVCVVMRKKGEFMTRKEFEKLDYYES